MKHATPYVQSGSCARTYTRRCLFDADAKAARLKHAFPREHNERRSKNSQVGSFRAFSRVILTHAEGPRAFPPEGQTVGARSCRLRANCRSPRRVRFAPEPDCVGAWGHHAGVCSRCLETTDRQAGYGHHDLSLSFGPSILQVSES